MPYELRWERRGVLKHHYGHLTGKEMLDATIAVSASDRYDGLRYIINDFSAVNTHTIAHADLEQFAALRIGAVHSNRRLLSPMIPGSEAGIMIAGFLQLPEYRNDHELVIFPNLDATRAWLAQFDKGWK